MARKHIEPLVKPHTGPVNPCGFSLMWWDFDHERIRVEPLTSADLDASIQQIVKGEA
jgi:hypothetical protein